ncbi:MAG: thiamine pyrophosphate-binding protein [Christensenellales bacterium]|jgi:acetolactate synthase-1/2/3 large subunit
MKQTIGGSTILAKCLKKEGITTIFTLSGGHTMSIYYACADEGIEVVDCRSEANAVMAADAYAKVTGGPAVVVTTAGPGTANTTTGMLEAMTGRTPVIQIGSSCALQVQGTGDMQDIDTLGVMRCCTKWAKKVYHTHRIADQMDDAFRHAMSGLPGPVYVEIPTDVLMGLADEEDVYISKKSRTTTLPAPDQNAVDEAVALLLEAKRPLMVIGNAARYSCEPATAVLELAEYLDMPVIAATISRGLFLPETHQLVQAGAAAAADADVVLTLCTANDLAFNKFESPAYNKNSNFIMVSPDSSNIGYNRDVEVGIVSGAAGAASAILKTLKKQTQPKKRGEHIEQLLTKADAIKASQHELIYGQSKEIRPGRCAAETVKFLNDMGRDWTIVPDGGDSGGWMNTLSVAHRGAQVIGLIGNGSIGIAPGSALGAYYGTRKPVLLYTGDGSFGYNFMEFANYVKRGFPIIVVVSNDSAWGMVKGCEHVIRPNLFLNYEKEHYDGLAVNLSFIRYDQIAEILGGYGELVETAEEIVPAIKRAAASGKPAIINVRVEDITLGGYGPRTTGYGHLLGQYAFDYTD